MIIEEDWQEFPKATKHLVCCEGLGGSKRTRAFPFFTIEAKNSLASIHDRAALHQNLNNASQALHNMYEFLKEAGEDQEKEFFEKVRFFSAVAMYEGVVIRIHWAKKTDKNTMYKPILGANNREDYPLQFEYEQFWPRNDSQPAGSKPYLDRQTIVQQIENIVSSYGANDLFPLLQRAAKRVAEKFSKDDTLFKKRASQFYYLHGQVPLTSKKTTRENTRENTPRAAGGDATNQTPEGEKAVPTPKKKRKFGK